jgi:hypothetical protein
MVLNNNISVISWRSVLLVEETGIHGENHWTVASNWQTWSHNVVSSTPHHEQGSNGVRPHKNVDGYNIECNVESEFVCKMAHDAKDTQMVKRDKV